MQPSHHARLHLVSDDSHGWYPCQVDRIYAFQYVTSSSAAPGVLEAFVEAVAANYDTIREGNMVAGNQTYRLELTDEHNNTVFVQLSRYGSYWNVNSAGIFKTKYSKNKKKVASVPAVGTSTNADADGVNHGQTEGATVTSGNSPATSESKGSEIPEENNEQLGNPTVAAIKEARQEVNTEPTDAQKKAGNYKMGHIKLDGYDISLENPKGSVRKGVDENGKAWESEMKNDYGYLRGTEGVDGDHINVFLSDTPDQGDVFVIDQLNPNTGEFDEHKVMYGFNSVEEAKAAYLANYKEGWQGLGSITPVSKDEFKKWIASSPVGQLLGWPDREEDSLLRFFCICIRRES